MPLECFISHSSNDRNIAEIFSSALKRLSLQQINPWFSSDSTGANGLQPGNIWFNSIIQKVTSSRAIVSILTPNSIGRPWIYFESGIGQALNDCEVIPICIGVKRDSILPPLGLYQCYQLNDYRSTVDFFSKLLALFNINFDEEMSKVVIEKVVSDISKISFENDVESEENKLSINNILENLKGHIDKRFVEILEKQNFRIRKHNQNERFGDGPNYDMIEEVDSSYSVSFSIEFPEFKNKELFLDIRQGDTFQSITNTLYFMLKDFVKPFKYLEEWVIVEVGTGKHVIIREIADKIPAKSIFQPDSEWKIIKLLSPYKAIESRSRLKK